MHLVNWFKDAEVTSILENIRLQLDKGGVLTVENKGVATERVNLASHLKWNILRGALGFLPWGAFFEWITMNPQTVPLGSNI